MIIGGSNNFSNLFGDNNLNNQNNFDEQIIEKNTQQNTTVIIENINKSLNSGKIYSILMNYIFPEKIFGKNLIYNAIYTPFIPGRKKNSGCCYINFINPIYIEFLNPNIKIFSKEGNCTISWGQWQGEEFLKIMNARKADQIELDYIIFG